ncbi:MAG: hypothetical protein HUU38_06755 [Anaerolineales bacterium]|nr:hypothetical protein [Anaerolineales bacterium]
MEKKNALTKGLTIVGTGLVWFPLLAPLLLSAVTGMVEGVFRLDYLMPAELFLVALLGGLLLLWAAIRMQARRGLIGWGLGLAVGLLVGSQVLAVVTGLAHGDTAPDGWAWILVLTLLGSYILAVMGVGIGGILLLRDQFKVPSQGSK